MSEPPDNGLGGFAKRYTAAWSSHDAERVAAFFSPNGSLKVNEGPPAIGRDSIREVVQGFMTVFPDLRLTMDGLEILEGRSIYRWSLLGRNPGPGRSGRWVHVNGFERWRIGRDSLIEESQGFFDAVEYQRQLKAAA